VPAYNCVSTGTNIGRGVTGEEQEEKGISVRLVDDI